MSLFNGGSGTPHHRSSPGEKCKLLNVVWVTPRKLVNFLGSQPFAGLAGLGEAVNYVLCKIFLGDLGKRYGKSQLKERTFLFTKHLCENSPSASRKDVGHPFLALDILSHNAFNMFGAGKFGDLLKLIKGNAYPFAAFLGKPADCIHDIIQRRQFVRCL